MTMKSAGGNTTFLSAVLVLVICCDVNSDLIIKPTEADAVVGGTTFFNCSTTLASSEIHWFHYVVGDTKDRSFVYGYDQFYSSYLGRFQMEKNVATGSYNLIITSISIHDAGRYECQDDFGRGDKDSAQLTVLDESPACQSNIKPQGFIGPNIFGFEPDELHMTCGVKFHGNQPPIMQWKEVGSNSPIAEGITHNASSDRAIYYLKIKVNSRMHGSSYQCVTTRSTTSQYGCTSDVVSVRDSSRTYVIIIVICVPAGLFLIVVSAFAGFKAGKRSATKKRGQTKNSNHEKSPAHEKSEQMELIDKQVVDIETIQNMTAENKRLLAEVNELGQQMYSSDNKARKTSATLAHTIVTQAAEKVNGQNQITGMTILEHSLFVVKNNYPVVEAYDSETFVYLRLLDKLHFTNPQDIASSKGNKLLYVTDRGNGESESKISKFNTSGEGGEMWTTENDDGRLSTYESNLIVCFSAKRIIIEYTPEGLTVNTVRLSPGNGFNKLWHAVKLTGTHFVVSHSKVEVGQRVCVVDIKGSVFAVFEELPVLSQGLVLNILGRDHHPICLVGQREEFVLVADSRHRRVLLLSPKELEYEAELLETDTTQTPVRLCLNEAKDRLFVGVGVVDTSWPIFSTSEAPKEGRILIYNLTK